MQVAGLGAGSTALANAWFLARFLRSLGQVAGTKLPITEALIRLASGLYAHDFTEYDHTVEGLGLAGLSRGGILAISVCDF